LDIENWELDIGHFFDASGLNPQGYSQVLAKMLMLDRNDKSL